MAWLITLNLGIKPFSTGQAGGGGALWPMAQFLFFGRFRDVSANKALTLPDGVKDTQSLVDWLVKTLDGFESEWLRPGARMAVNKVLVIEGEPVLVSDEDEIAFMSALSGG